MPEQNSEADAVAAIQQQTVQAAATSTALRSGEIQGLTASLAVVDTLRAEIIAKLRALGVGE